jgi:hypothetical protein
LLNSVTLVALLLALITPAPLPAAHKDTKAGQVVDSGSFTIFVKGRRIGTESFTVQQRLDLSVASAEVRIDDGNGSRATQDSELKLAPNGDFNHYQWRELSPGKAETSVEFKDQFLVQHVAMNAGEKPTERAFMLPPATMVLDDNFFVHREILAWRYIASACGVGAPMTTCRMERAEFGVFVPRQQASIVVTMEYRGRENVQIHGADRELDRFALLSDGVEWTLWIDPAFKVQRIVVPSEGVEVVRD